MASVFADNGRHHPKFNHALAYLNHCVRGVAWRILRRKTGTPKEKIRPVKEFFKKRFDGRHHGSNGIRSPVLDRLRQPRLHLHR